MKLGIRTRLFLVSLALVATALAGAQLLLAPRLDAFLIEQVHDDLAVRLRLCAAAAQARPDADLGALSHDLAARAQARITLVGRDGRVLGDSSVGADRLGELDNHLSRPEVRSALSLGHGYSVHLSSTLGGRMLYVAVPFRRDGEVAGVVRAALPLTEVDETLSRVRSLAATAALVMLAAGATLAAAAAHWTSSSLRRLTGAARAMAAGDLSVRTRVAGRDEVAALGGALDTLAQSLAASMEALRAERDLRDRILMGMREGVLHLDAAGRVLLVNPALRELLGLSPDLSGQALLDAVRHGRLAGLLDRAAREGREVSEELEFPGPPPRRLLVHVAHPRGEQPGLLAVFFDVTDLRRLEAVRRDFVANASHELRTPIAAVRSAAETLADALHDDPEAAAGLAQVVLRNSERLHLLVADLLDLSRIESRQLPLSPEPVALPAACERVASAFAQRAQRRGLRLAVLGAPGLPPALADPGALEQILTNLVDNAVKYCSEGGAITLRAQGDGELLAVAVEDTGPGIEARHLPRLFERFYRVDAGRSRELGGTGLGLSIVRHLAESMGGSVAVQSEPGRGSRFVVRLPRAPGA